MATLTCPWERSFGAPQKKQKGFTLAELIVVFGVIAILTALIMPTAVTARHHALRTKCLSSIAEYARSTTIASQDYGGYAQVCGTIEVPRTPTNAQQFQLLIGDPLGRRYMYQTFEFWPGGVVPASFHSWLQSRFNEPTQCPVQIDSTSESAKAAHLVIFGPSSLSLGDVTARRSYVPNAFVFAYSYRSVSKNGSAIIPLAGRLSAVRRPSVVVLFSEASVKKGVYELGGTTRGWPFSLGELKTANEAAEGDFVFGIRHAGRTVVAFVDGHAELVPSTVSRLRAYRIVDTGD